MVERCPVPPCGAHDDEGEDFGLRGSGWSPRFRPPAWQGAGDPELLVTERGALAAEGVDSYGHALY